MRGKSGIDVVAGLSVIVPPGVIDPARVGPAIRAAARAISRSLGARAVALPLLAGDGE